jgi:hypothetical protein
MIVLKFNWKEPMVVCCRVGGINNKFRELSALLDFNHVYCLMLRQDASDLGYSDASYQHRSWSGFCPDRAPVVLRPHGLERTILITLKEVSIGSLVARHVDAVVTELEFAPTAIFDMILGWSFLRNFKLEVDPKSNSLFLA